MRNGVDCKGNVWEERTLNKRIKDLTGKKFTKLTVLFPVYVQDRPLKKCYWLCKCDCGNYIVCRADCLHNQHIQSCGCMVIEGVYKKSQAIADKMIGKRFGKLIIDEFIGYKMDNRGIGKALYKCTCDCGNNNFMVIGNSLTSGATLSCGCLTRSIGEENIENILKDNNIRFKPEYVFSDLRSNRDGYLRYDFAILDENDVPIRLIEFDGTQHEYPCEYFGGEDEFKRQQENDALKNQYALSHNVPLIRIPYYLRDHMTLKDLMGDNFLVLNNKVAS